MPIFSLGGDYGIILKKHTRHDEIVKILFGDVKAGTKLTKTDLQKALIPFFNNSTRILNDCQKLAKETTNSKVFFERLDMLIDWLHKAIIVEQKFQLYKKSIEVQYKQVLRNKTQTIKCFIDIYTEMINIKTGSLKTIATREKFVNKSMKNFEMFRANMTEESFDYCRMKISDINFIE